MPVEGIANLFQNLANQLDGQTHGTHAGTKILGTGKSVSAPVTEDTFTSSTQNSSAQATAQDAGIFQVNQIALPAVTANIILGQATPQANQKGAPAQAAPAAKTNADKAQAATATNSNTTINSAQQATGSPAAQAAASATASTLNVQAQIQALNAALPALGLTNAEIQQIDRIASLIQNFNPAAYANLVNQFEAAAQQSAQQSTANAAANAGNFTSPNTAANTNANGGGFQVQEILIHFTGQQGTASNAAQSSGGQGSAGNNFQITAPTLQIDQAQFTLANGNGQTIHVKTPQQNTNAGTTNQRAHNPRR